MLLTARSVPLAAAETPGQRLGLLSTAFSMELGETVVVGTSKLDGSDKALVVLLTALP